MTSPGRPTLLVIDTATTSVVIATGSDEGSIDGLATWVAGHRHGETLLRAVERFLAERRIDRSDLAGIVVGTGPGAFTGLRVGMATAKGLAHGLRIPLVGVSTAEALLAASGAERPVLLLPAGPSDRVLVRPGTAPELLPGGTDPDLAAGERLVAVDLEDRAPAEATARGGAARDGLAAALLLAGAARIRAMAAGSPMGELATLVPEYVTLPRGARAATGTVAWSRDPR
jgi:hypothetical protein